MEVSGKETAFTKQIPNLYCVPCGRDGLKETVHGYCQNCEEHLCKTYFQHHRRPRPTKNHVLLDKDSMPLQTAPVDINHDVITDTCTIHRDKPLEFYCRYHNSVACYVCVTLGHKQCGVYYIPDVSGNVSEEFKDLIRYMEVLVKKCESNIQKAKCFTKHLDKSHEKVVEEIRQLRKEINAHLDEMESRILNEAKSFVNKAKCKLENTKRASAEIAEEMKRAQSLLNGLSEEKKMNKLFTEMKKIAPRVKSLSDNEIQTIEDNRTDDSIDFVGNKMMLEKLKSEKSFGKLSSYKLPTPERTLCLQYDRDINFTLESEKEISDCSGVIMIMRKCIVADRGNQKIKSIDTFCDEVISAEISSAPTDIINLSVLEFAIALCEERCIQLMYGWGKLEPYHRINVGEKYNCIAYCQNKLVVGYASNPGKLVIMNLHGKITQVFDTPGLFDGPEKIIISSDEKFLYVSDYCYSKGSRLIKMDWEGTIVQTWKKTGYNRPVGIQELEDDTILVCYSDKIVRLSSNFEICEIKGLNESMLYNPSAVAYSEKDHKLYVSCSSKKTKIYRDTIKIFNIIWM